MALLLVAVSAVLVAYDLSRGGEGRAASADGAQVETAAESASGAAPGLSPSAGTAAAATPSVAATGPGTFTYAAGTGPVLGTGGALRPFRVAVEDGIGVTAEEFAAAVEGVLGDPRSWIAGGDVRLQRVAGTSDADFTVLLATPATSERICREEWLETEQYTNCRLSDDRVVINLARWLTAVPDYGAPLGEYRAYAINHEVGHQLGHGHERCPGPGQPAPVMQQQTLGLQGCLAYGWPYLDGARYRGPGTQGV